MKDLQEIAREQAARASALTGHGPKDWQTLADARATTSGWAPRISSDFIQVLASHPSASWFLGEGRDLRETALARWMDNLLTGTPSQGFWAECAMVGLLHAARGVPATLVVAATHRIESMFLHHCMAALDPLPAMQLHGAFCRVLSTAVAVMTATAEEATMECLVELGYPPARFSQRLGITIQHHVRRERSTQPKLDWTADLSVGVHSIDEQHRELFSLLNQFHQVTSDEGDEALFREVVGELIDYTKIHFGFEETLLQKHGYPDLEAHRLAHRGLANQVHRYASTANFGAGPLAAELYLFLKTWLNGHIRGSDKRYSLHLKERGVA